MQHLKNWQSGEQETTGQQIRIEQATMSVCIPKMSLIGQGKLRRNNGPGFYIPRKMENNESERPHTSAVRHRPVETVNLQKEHRMRFHWLLFVGIALFIMIAGWLSLSALGQWWQGVQDNWKYGMPRTFQTDKYVGQGDTTPVSISFQEVNGKQEMQVSIGDSNPYTVILLNNGTSFQPSH